MRKILSLKCLIVAYGIFSFLWLLYLYRCSTSNAIRSYERTNENHNEIALSIPSTCGSWAHEYAKLHKTILKETAYEDQRLTVLDAGDNGISDRLTQAVTIFLYALLSRRALKIRWTNTAPLESSFLPTNINWTYTDSDATGEEEFLVDYDLKSSAIGYDDLQINYLFGHTNLSAIGDGIRTVRWTLNQGQIHNLFDNPYHRDQLFSMGLRPDTAFGCIFQFLFQPRPEVKNLVEREAELLHLDVNSLQEPQPIGHFLRIGLQIRLTHDGLEQDKRCWDDPLSDHFVQKFFRCAEEIEQFALVENMSAIWYLTTDCVHLRTNAAEWFKGKLTTSSRRIRHSGKLRNVEDFRYTVGENWLLGGMDFFVISRNSNFGRIAALRSLKWRRTYSIADNRRNQSCGRGQFTSFERLSREWVRV